MRLLQVWLIIFTVISFAAPWASDALLPAAQAAERGLTDFASGIQAAQRNEIVSLDPDPFGDLKPLDDAKVLFQRIADYLQSPEVLTAEKQSETLRLLKSRLQTSIFHLNFVPEVVETNRPHYSTISNKYPYEAVYEKPFPKRPSIEALDQALEFLSQVRKSSPQLQTSATANLATSIRSYAPFKGFKQELTERLTKQSSTPVSSYPLSKNEIVSHPVDAYTIMRDRLRQKGEIAPFTEMSSTVDQSLTALRTSPDIKALAAKDPVFKREVQAAIHELETVKSGTGAATATQAAFNSAFPYRRTYNALEKAVTVFDLKDRLQHPESKNWYEVEDSWHAADSGYKGEKKLLPLYHYNRYKYQQFGLLSNPNVVLLPLTGELSEEDLIRLRPTPISIIGVNADTARVDRHLNTPLDFWYHDINHVRRMWGYDRQLIEDQGLKTWGQLTDDMHKREAFVGNLLAKSDPNAVTGSTESATKLRQLKRQERDLIFETVHETALPATRDALLNDLLRVAPVRQPFERQIQAERSIEFTRTFDGNVDSGADKLALDLSKPTKIEYYFDRAPSFISNVNNKTNWGFFQSVYEDRKDPAVLKYRTPENLAQAASNVLDHLDFKDGERGLSRPSLREMAKEAKSQVGQPELYYYYALHPEEDISEHGKALIDKPPARELVRPETIAARAIHDANPVLKPAEVAQKTNISKNQKDLLAWMKQDLEHYSANFDQIFQAKLDRIKIHQQQRTQDLDEALKPLKAKLQALAPGNSVERTALENEIARVTKEGKPFGFVKHLGNGHDVYVDTWGVPFYDTATQSKALAKKGVDETLKEFSSLNLTKDISVHQFSDLMAQFARPEFDDLRRYKLQMFPSTQDLARFGSERSDARVLGTHYPTDSFIVTNKALDIDELSNAFGRRVHYLGLISHAKTDATADGRLFTGPADFLEHDQTHAYFNFQNPVPGNPAEWEKVNDNFLFLQGQEPDMLKRKMKSLIYFHMTHESGYTSLLSANGAPLNSGTDQAELQKIKELIDTRYHYDFVKDPKLFPNGYKDLLEQSYAEVHDFFKSNLHQIQGPAATKTADLAKAADLATPIETTKPVALSTANPSQSQCMILQLQRLLGAP